MKGPINSKEKKCKIIGKFDKIIPAIYTASSIRICRSKKVGDDNSLK